MRSVCHYLSAMLFLIFVFISLPSFAEEKINIPILCYHNFNPTKRGSMNLTPKKFEEQLMWLKQHGFTIIPLKDAVAYLQGKRTDLPSKSVVITLDDGWQSQYDYIYPLVMKYKVPVTLFIYPETISNGKNALTWDELKKLQQTGLFDIEGHTYSHPNFKQMKKRMSAAKYQAFVQKELAGSKKILEENLGKEVTLLAWPFGIYDEDLEREAANAGYTMAFSIDARTANKSFKAMSQPRYMIVDGLSEGRFEAIANSAKVKVN